MVVYFEVKKIKFRNAGEDFMLLVYDFSEKRDIPNYSCLTDENEE